VTAPLFLRALRGERVERFPVWMMRQAGRWLPGYRAIRAETPFLDLCRDPEKALRVSLEPVERFDLDAAIVFADILLVADAMGVPVRFGDAGPSIAAPLRTAADVSAVSASPDMSGLAPVFETVRRLVREVGPQEAVIGFSSAPFTLAAYAAEGGTSRDFGEARRFLHRDPEGFEALVDRLARGLVPYLRGQAEAGAHALMLFDTWAGVLSPAQYARVAAPAVRRIVEALGPGSPPTILFAGLGADPMLEEAAATGVAALSVDWRSDLATAYARVGGRVRLQGNLDPTALHAAPDAVEASVSAMLSGVPPGVSHLANVGHGLLPDTPVAGADAFVRAVRAWRPVPVVAGAVS
jgi:uroporphyrinogen decarboxylase